MCVGRNLSPGCARRRAGERGAIAVEGLIVSLFMVLVFAGMLFMYKTFSGKWETMQEARTQAWLYALNGCREAAVDGVYRSIHEKSKDPGADTCGDNCEGQSLDGLSNEGDAAPPAWMAVGETDEQAATRQYNGVLWGPREVTTRYAPSCNEKQNREQLSLGSSSLLQGMQSTAQRIINEEFSPDLVGEQSACYTKVVFGIKKKVHDGKCKVELGALAFTRTTTIQVQPPPLDAP